MCRLQHLPTHNTLHPADVCVSTSFQCLIYSVHQRAGNIKIKMRSILCVCVSILYTRTTSISLRPNGRLALFFLDLLSSKSFVSLFFLCVFTKRRAAMSTEVFLSACGRAKPWPNFRRTTSGRRVVAAAATAYRQHSLLCIDF